MTPLPAPMSWEDEIAAAAIEQFNGAFVVEQPGDPGTYDPTEDEYTGGTDATVIQAERPGRIQHVRLPLESSDGDGYTVRRRVRIQCELRDGDEIITKGLVVRVTDGGRDASLEAFTYQVVSAINSSHAALRTLECITEAGQ